MNPPLAAERDTRKVSPARRMAQGYSEWINSERPATLAYRINLEGSRAPVILAVARACIRIS